MQSHIGSQIKLQKFLKTLNGFTYNTDNKDELLINKQLTKQASEKLASFVYLQNADQLEYGSILKTLSYQNYLKMINTLKMLEATNVISNHWYGNANQTKQNKKLQVQKNDKDEDNN